MPGTSLQQHDRSSEAQQGAPWRLTCPVIITLALATSLLWNRWAGLVWKPGLALMLAIPLGCFVISAIYRYARPDKVIAEATFYAGLWLAFSVAGVRLSYLAATLDFPYRDAALAAIDAGLGFDWLKWTLFNDSHPWLRSIEAAAYLSYFYQPFVCVPLLAKWGPAHGNREFLLATLIAVLLCAAISVLVPALGPSSSHGIPSFWDGTLQALRSGGRGPFAYIGIITFPSLHTIMAILCCASQRRNRWSFPVFLVLNFCTLVSIPSLGHHYLSDMIAGGAVAVVSLWGAVQLTAPRGSAE